jgi:transposase-like protein
MTDKKRNPTVEKRMRKHQKEFLEVLDKAALNISHACKKINISRNTFYLWMRDFPDFKEAVEELQEADKDFVETQIRRKIMDGDTTMLIFYAKTKMKERGYVERHDIGYAGENPFIEMMQAASEYFESDEKIDASNKGTVSS